VLALVARDALSMDQAEAQLRQLRDREAALRKELDRPDVALAEVPSKESLQCYIEQIATASGGRAIWLTDEEGNAYAGGDDLVTWYSMTHEDKRRLVEAVFDGAMVDGKPAGVYVEPAVPMTMPGRPKKWLFRIRGRLDFEVLVSRNAGR
jgi:hypothetical protein